MRTCWIVFILFAWGVQAAPVTRVKAKRATASVNPFSRTLVSLSTTLDWSRAWVSYDSSLSRGLGFSMGLSVAFPLTDRFRLLTGLHYQGLSLDREVDASGSLENTNPTPFSHSLGFLGIQLVGGYLVEMQGPDPFGLWIEGGAEYDYPLGVSQTIRDAGAQTVSYNDRPILALAGVALDFPLTDPLLLSGRLHLFYNLASASGTRYLGLRLGIALALGL